MQIIKLSRGFVAIVDNEDYEHLVEYSWYASTSNTNSVYAYHSIDRNTKISMHQFITGYSKVDHINGCGIDNRKDNLRECNSTENSRNTNKQKTYRGKRTSSKFKGVYRCTRTRKWRAHIQIDGVLKHLGTFDEEIKAAAFYDLAAIKYFKEFAKTNFPIEEWNEVL